MQERLQKVLASAGLASRRACEEMILEGRVSVNGQAVYTLPVLVDPAHDAITVDGRPIRAAQHVYYMLHKPKGVHCTNHDPQGRKRAVDLMPQVRERVYCVGRLDADSTGLLLMTNDGELAQRLMHPRFGIAKTYRAHVDGWVGEDEVATLREGIWLAEGRSRIVQVKLIHAARDRSVVELTLNEGRNREVRRVLAKVGHKVRRLIRIKLGPLSLRGLAEGASRPLTRPEIDALRKLVSTQPQPGVRPGGSKPRRKTHRKS